MRLDVRASTPIDQDWRLVASELEPGEQVTIAVAADAGASSYPFRAAGDGTVDTSRDVPLDGAWSTPDAFGLLWSMGGRVRPEHLGRSVQPLRYTITVTGDGEAQTVEAERMFLSDRVSELSVDAVRELSADVDGELSADIVGGTVPGTGYAPIDGGPHPGVVLLSGSDGGHHPGMAAVLARHGYAVWSLPYFGDPGFAEQGLPEELVSIDVGTVAAQLRRFHGCDRVRADRPLAVAAISRGSELAFELASRHPDLVGPVVAAAPCGLRNTGLPRRRGREDQPAWVDGDTVPAYVHTLRDRAGMRTLVTTLLWPMLRGRPVELVHSFRAQWERSPDLDDARIDLRAARGPILLWAGERDLMWPSATYARDISARLRDADMAVEADMTVGGDVAFDVEAPVDTAIANPAVEVEVHIDATAGHLGCYPFALPGMPIPTVTPTRRPRFALGGDPGSASRAAAATKGVVLEFLDRAFR